jgi:DegV family protein with EDD domain
MNSLAIVTDSTAYLPQEYVQQHGVAVVPLIVHFGTQAYKEGIEILADQFYERLASDPLMPTTSQPSIGDFVQIYEELLKTHEQVLTITFSSGLSGTFQTAQAAARMVDGDIQVIDSRITSYPLAEMVREAVRLRDEGHSREVIAARIEEMSRQMRAYFVVDSLDHLHRGGRLSKASALVGSLLQIKPILTVNEEGKLDVFEKVRTRRKAVDRLLELLREQTTPGQKVRLGVIYSANREDAEALQQRIGQEFPSVETSLSELGPVIGTHTGPGVLAIAFYPVSRP